MIFQRQETRRSFVKLTSAGALWLAAGRKQSRSETTPSALGGLPTLDGELLVDTSARRGAADDFGHHIRREPIAVLRPAHVNDVIRIVSYAYQHKLKVAMRGRGHSTYGQAQVHAGIVIDSSSLNRTEWQGDGSIDVQPGASWGDVAKRTLERGATPPVIPDTHILSVGGTLSAGGIGETSHRFGAQVDHISEIDVVTGTGDLVTCSQTQNVETFRMALAGMGQCGLIVRARQRLVPAPERVITRVFTYDNLDSFLDDQVRLSTTEKIGSLTGRLTRNSQGRWEMLLITGTFLGATDTGQAPSWAANLKSTSAGAPATKSYWDWLDRLTAFFDREKATGAWQTRPHLPLVMQMPSASVRSFLKYVLATPDAFIGITRFDVFPMITAHFQQPLVKMPESDLAFGVRLLRTASAENAPDQAQMLAANQKLLPRVLSVGGKLYPAFCPIASREEWQQHYGADTWARFKAAKAQLDPKSVLTPGAGIF